MTAVNSVNSWPVYSLVPCCFRRFVWHIHGIFVKTFFHKMMFRRYRSAINSLEKIAFAAQSVDERSVQHHLRSVPHNDSCDYYCSKFVASRPCVRDYFNRSTYVSFVLTYYQPVSLPAPLPLCLSKFFLNLKLVSCIPVLLLIFLSFG